MQVRIRIVCALMQCITGNSVSWYHERDRPLCYAFGLYSTGFSQADLCYIMVELSFLSRRSIHPSRLRRRQRALATCSVRATGFAVTAASGFVYKLSVEACYKCTLALQMIRRGSCPSPPKYSILLRRRSKVTFSIRSAYVH
jgi:hypothetical protein